MKITYILIDDVKRLSPMLLPAMLFALMVWAHSAIYVVP